MGGIGKAFKKLVRGIEKVWKKLDPLTFKILEKLGLRGKHVTHTYLMVQPLHSGYQHDPIKTLIAEAIGLDIDLPEYLVKSLQKGAGIDLMRYYHYQRIRIKKYNMKSAVTITKGIAQISQKESRDIITKYFPYRPEFKDKPIVVMDISEYPTDIGGFWAYIMDNKSNLEHVVTQRSPINPINPKQQVAIVDNPRKDTIKVDTKDIDVLHIGSIQWTDKEGQKRYSPMYFGTTDLGSYQNADYFYFYDTNLNNYLDKHYAYIVFYIDVSDTTQSAYELENYFILYGNNETNTDFYNTLKKAYSNEETNEEAIEHKYFKFYQALPLKRKSQHTIGFKDGDPYEGTYDPDKHLVKEEEKLSKLKPSVFRPDSPSKAEARKKQQDKVDKISKVNSQNKDSETKKIPRTRNTTPAGYVKPRKVAMRLRRKVKKTVTATELRKYEQAARLLGENYEALVGQLIHSEQDRNNPEVHHSYILPSVTLNSKVQEVKEYWYTFMKRAYNKLHNGKPISMNFDLNAGVINRLGEQSINKLKAQGTLPNTNEIEFDADAYGLPLKPFTYSVVGSTIDNTIDPLIFGLSYVSITRFRIKGNLKDKKKRRKKPYYDIKVGRTNNGTLVRSTIRATNIGTERKPNWVYSSVGSSRVLEANDNNFSFTTEHKEAKSHTDFHNSANSYDYSDTLEDPNVSSYTCFCKQVGDEIDIIAVRGLSFFSTVHDKGTAISAQDYLLNYSEIEKSGFYNMFTMPVCYKTLRSSGLISNTRFASRSIQRLDYSTKDEYVPWHARSAFKVVLTIVQIILFIVTIWSGGWGASLVEIAKQGAMAVAKELLYRIAISIAINLAISAVVKALGKIFGAEFAAIIGAVAAVVMTAYGVSDGMGLQLPYASQVFMVAPAIINGSMQALGSMQANVQAMIEKEKEAFKKATEKLEEDKQYFEDFVNSDIDPQAFVSALTQRVERLDDFITRTLETNMNQFADLDYLADSIDNSLVIDYMPNLADNWTGIPTDTSMEDEPVNLPSI